MFFKATALSFTDSAAFFDKKALLLYYREHSELGHHACLQEHSLPSRKGFSEGTAMLFVFITIICKDHLYGNQKHRHYRAR